MPIPDRLAHDVEELRAAISNTVEIVEDGTRYLVIVKDFELPVGYQPQVTDFMIIADYQYPQSALDMFWTHPHVSRVPTGTWPQSADQFCDFDGRNWQRWSWHYQGWNPATHSVFTHFETCRDRLFKGS